MINILIILESILVLAIEANSIKKKQKRKIISPKREVSVTFETKGVSGLMKSNLKIG